MHITMKQAGQYARNAGWNGNNVVTAIAVCYAESGGNSTETNHDSNGTIDYGCMQVNSVHGYDSNRLLSDIQYNFDCAYAVWKGQGWHGWSTYNNGSYAAFVGPAMVAADAKHVVLPEESSSATQPIDTTDTQNANVGTTGPTGAYGNTVHVLNSVTSDGFWRHWGIILFGVILALVGVFFMFSKQVHGGVRKVAKTVGTVAAVA